MYEGNVHKPIYSVGKPDLFFEMFFGYDCNPAEHLLLS
jgi:hypothetical protein